MENYQVIILAVVVIVFIVVVSVWLWRWLWCLIKKLVCSKYILCSKHKTPVMDYKTDIHQWTCKDCVEEENEWRFGLWESLESSDVNPRSKKRHIGSIFYWKHKGWGDLVIMDKAKKAHDWLRDNYCPLHKPHSGCDCISYFRIIKHWEFDVKFSVLLNNETFLPKMLIFEIDLVDEPGTVNFVSYGDSKEVSDVQSFDQVFNQFFLQANEIIVRHGIRGTGWIDRSILTTGHFREVK